MILIKHGERTLVTGWGSTQGTGSYQYLREVEVPIQSNDQCGLKSISWETSLCAGLCENSTCDACQVNIKFDKKFSNNRSFLSRAIQVVQ